MLQKLAWLPLCAMPQGCMDSRAKSAPGSSSLYLYLGERVGSSPQGNIVFCLSPGDHKPSWSSTVASGVQGEGIQ